MAKGVGKSIIALDRVDRDLITYPDGKKEETYWYEGEIRKLLSGSN